MPIEQYGQFQDSSSNTSNALSNFKPLTVTFFLFKKQLFTKKLKADKNANFYFMIKHFRRIAEVGEEQSVFIYVEKRLIHLEEKLGDVWQKYACRETGMLRLTVRIGYPF